MADMIAGPSDPRSRFFVPESMEALAMASISAAANGFRTIQFVGSDRKRRTLRLGKVSQRQAEGVRVRVEHLVSASITRSAPDAETARWVASLDDAMHAKMAAVGLIAPRDRVEVGAFVEAYIQSRHDTKPRTEILYRETLANLVEFFGESKPMRDVTPGDADAYRLFLLGKGLAENTVRRRLGRAKQFFTAALRRRLIESNPFADQKCAVGNNPARMRFITREEIEQVLEVCPDDDWRLIVALARFGGLRTPSETLSLRWSDVDWERERMIVRSPKTEHLEGKDCRAVPLFPELRPYLDAAFDRAEDGAEFVVQRFQGHTNLGVPFRKIIVRAGITPWPKLFQNLRATRETELAETFPMHVVCSWIGNSQPVAAKHYLQVTDEHFKAAAMALQNPVQQASAEAGIDSHALNNAQEETPGMPGFAMHCDTMQCTEVPPLGLEPRTY